MEITDLPHDLSAVAATVIAAMHNGKAIELDYDGLVRHVEVHACGVSRAGNAVFRAYQFSGFSASGEDEGWKLFDIGKVYGMPVILDIPSAAPRPGFQPGDKGMFYIFDEVTP